jgi:hypothetical protein
MLKASDVILNKVAQKRLPFEDAISWFQQLQPIERSETLAALLMMVQQSHPTEEAINSAIGNAGVKQGVTPAVLLRTQSLKIAMNKITALPTTEYKNVFTVLMSVFQVADTLRRENECNGGCTHEWHNLPD